MLYHFFENVAAWCEKQLRHDVDGAPGRSGYSAAANSGVAEVFTAATASVY